MKLGIEHLLCRAFAISLVKDPKISSALGFYSIQGHLFYIDLRTRVEGNDALKLWSIDLNVADE